MLDPNTTYMSGGKPVLGYVLNAQRSLNNAAIAMLERKHKEAKAKAKKTPNAKAQRPEGYADAPCSACFGRGWIYGPIDAYPITEAQEEPEVLQCPKCNGTGKKPNGANAPASPKGRKG